MQLNVSRETFDHFSSHIFIYFSNLFTIPFLFLFLYYPFYFLFLQMFHVKHLAFSVHAIIISSYAITIHHFSFIIFVLPCFWRMFHVKHSPLPPSKSMQKMFVTSPRMTYNRCNNCHSNKEVIYHEEKCSAFIND